MSEFFVALESLDLVHQIRCIFEQGGRQVLRDILVEGGGHLSHSHQTDPAFSLRKQLCHDLLGIVTVRVSQRRKIGDADSLFYPAQGPRRRVRFPGSASPVP